MKNLALGALLVAATSSGCIISSDDTINVTASWTFVHQADKTARSCPVGFETAAVTAQEVTPLSVRPVGSPIIDLYNCSDGAGFDKLRRNTTYLMWVEIQHEDPVTGAVTTYAKGGEAFIDTGIDSGFDTRILDDGGYFFLTWDLQGKSSGATLTCADAGVSSAGSVETVSTSVANPSSFITDKFTCTDHFGTTGGLVAGRYTVSVDAEDGAGALGAPVNLTNKDINAPNGLTDLGHVILPIDGQ